MSMKSAVIQWEKGCHIFQWDIMGKPEFMGHDLIQWEITRKPEFTGYNLIQWEISGKHEFTGCDLIQWEIMGKHELMGCDLIQQEIMENMNSWDMIKFNGKSQENIYINWDSWGQSNSEMGATIKY